MNRATWVVSSLALTLFLVSESGCATSEVRQLDVAALEVSTEYLEFGDVGEGVSRVRTLTISNTGDVSLGLKSVELVSALEEDRGHEEAFSVQWDALDLIVPESADVTTTARMSSDGATTTPTTTTSATDDTGLVIDEVALEMPPGSTLPIQITFSPVVSGDNYDAVLITTIDGDDTVTDSSDRVYRDADNTWRMAYLHGYNDAAAGNLIVSPRTTDVGFVWPGQRVNRFITIENVGDGPIELITTAVDEDNCSDGFFIVTIPEDGTVVAGGHSTVIEVVYEPEEFDEAQCKIDITSDDPDTDSIEVVIKANIGDNANNSAPTVVVNSPEGGIRHEGWGGLEMDISVSDPDQPANTLVCKVRSALQLNASLATCTPTEANGRVTISVPMEYHEAGLDVLVVQVTDDSEVTRKASVPVIINAPYPPDDDDGDGFVLNDPLYPDCDDTNGSTYPFAAEVHDGQDNDCDLQVDEDTDGSDDDQDGMSETEGDCNDNSVDTYLGAPELQDGADNNCNGMIDEGTSAFDDDEDGFAEIDMDCDDDDPALNPATPELCSDGIDNNCNGLKDSQEPCIEIDSEPMLVGLINLSRTSIEEGGATQASVMVVDADGDTVTHSWEAQNGEGTIDDPSSASITWVAPEDLPDGYDNGNLYRLYYLGADDDNNQVWSFQEVWVYPSNSLNDTIVQTTAGQGSCAVAPVGLAAGGWLIALGALIRRRRS